MKIVAYYSPVSQIKAENAAHELRNIEINNVRVRRLSADYEREVDEEIFISRCERRYFMWGSIIGVVVGLVVAYLSQMGFLIFPLLLPLFAAGPVGLYLFWIGTGLMLGALIGSLLGLLYAVDDLYEGGYILIVYGPTGLKNRIYQIIDRSDGYII